MKTTVLITAVLSLQASTLFAAIDNAPEIKANESNASYCVSLVPDVPSEATFEEDATLADFDALAPVIPSEAGFENEESNYCAQEIVDLNPVVPAEADFSEKFVLHATDDVKLLAPVVPAAAGFADTF